MSLELSFQLVCYPSNIKLYFIKMKKSKDIIKYGKRKDSRRMRKGVDSVPKISQEVQDMGNNNDGRKKTLFI